jgi:hypothetical protein
LLVRVWRGRLVSGEGMSKHTQVFLEFKKQSYYEAFYSQRGRFNLETCLLSKDVGSGLLLLLSSCGQRIQDIYDLFRHPSILTDFQNNGLENSSQMYRQIFLLPPKIPDTV